MIYLDNAATTFPKPREVLKQMVRQYRLLGVSPGRGSYDLATEAEVFIRQTRVKLAGFFGAPDPERLIFTGNATDGLNLAISGLVHAGDHVVTTRLEHNSVLRPLYHLEQQQKITCSLIPFDNRGFINPDDIVAALRPKHGWSSSPMPPTCLARSSRLPKSAPFAPGMEFPSWLTPRKAPARSK